VSSASDFEFITGYGTLARVQYELLVGLRYTRAKRRNHFISFISLTSMLGIALGVAALIVVLSVMNGFQKEVRARILGVVSHVQITGAENRLDGWQAVAREAGENPLVEAAAPFVNAQGMLMLGSAVRGVVVRGVLPELEKRSPVSACTWSRESSSRSSPAASGS